jgi:hypothetical protein
MVARDHHVTPLQTDPSTKRKEEKGCCPFHRDQPLRYYCKRCDVGICLECRAKSHDGHATIDLHQAAVEAREELTTLAATAAEQVSVGCCCPMLFEYSVLFYESRQSTRIN